LQPGVFDAIQTIGHFLHWQPHVDNIDTFPTTF
jgi:hypothetical protein